MCFKLGLGIVNCSWGRLCMGMVLADCLCHVISRCSAHQSLLVPKRLLRSTVVRVRVTRGPCRAYPSARRQERGPEPHVGLLGNYQASEQRSTTLAQEKAGCTCSARLLAGHTQTSQSTSKAVIAHMPPITNAPPCASCANPVLLPDCSRVLEGQLHSIQQF